MATRAPIGLDASVLTCLPKAPTSSGGLVAARASRYPEGETGLAPLNAAAGHKRDQLRRATALRTTLLVGPRT